jgi:DNA-3-methyladenine glycosylase II
MDKLLAAFYPTPPYDFNLTASAARYYTTLGVWRGGCYWRAIRAGDGIALVKIANRGSIDAPALDVWLVDWQGDIDETALTTTAARMLNLSLTVAPFYALARSDAAMSPIVEALYGLHSFQTESLYEALTITVIEQQIALASAQRGERWLIGWAGEQLTYGGESFYTFPRAARLAAASVEDLTPLKITFGRMQRLIDIARLETQHSFERFRDLPHEAIYAALTALKGVGHWTAAWTMNRGLGQFVYVGSADVALRAAVNWYFYGQKGRAEPALTDALFARYGENAGLAAYYTLMKWALDRYPRTED